MIKKIPIIGLAVVSAIMGLGAIAFISIVKAIDEAHDHDYFWE